MVYIVYMSKKINYWKRNNPELKSELITAQMVSIVYPLLSNGETEIKIALLDV